LTEVVIETTGTLQGGGWLAYIPRLKPGFSCSHYDNITCANSIFFWRFQLGRPSYQLFRHWLK